MGWIIKVFMYQKIDLKKITYMIRAFIWSKLSYGGAYVSFDTVAVRDKHFTAVFSVG